MDVRRSHFLMVQSNIFTLMEWRSAILRMALYRRSNPMVTTPLSFLMGRKKFIQKTLRYVVDPAHQITTMRVNTLNLAITLISHDALVTALLESTGQISM